MLIDYIGKLETTLVDPIKLSNVVKNDVKKTVHDELIKKVNAIQAIDTSDLFRKADNDTKIVDMKNKTPNDLNTAEQRAIREE